MKPDSNLDALLQDGYSLKNVPNYGRLGVQDVAISIHQIGELILTSGRIIACDPLMGPDTRYYFKKTIEPGRYPVIVSVANFQSSGETHIACAMLRISDRTPVRWEAAFINEPNPKRADDQVFYGVDAGTGCFVDLDAAQILDYVFPDFEGFCDRIVAEMESSSFGKYGSAGWANIQVNVDSSCKCNRLLFEEYLIRRLIAKRLARAIV
jgi:hypothetical protein